MNSESHVPNESGGSPLIGGVPTIPRPVENEQAILELLADGTARSILCAVDEPMTAKELAADCELPLSTVYRKLEELSATPLLRETTRVRECGKHPQQFQRRFDALQVDVPVGSRTGVVVSIRPRSGALTGGARDAGDQRSVDRRAATDDEIDGDHG
ncbi:MAG: helix-turn-helix domain-containing protein [Haloarculaceae archaeon]